MIKKLIAFFRAQWRKVPLCPDCSRDAVLDHLGVPPRWRCDKCRLIWWQEAHERKPVAYGHPYTRPALKRHPDE